MKKSPTGTLILDFSLKNGKEYTSVAWFIQAFVQGFVKEYANWHLDLVTMWFCPESLSCCMCGFQTQLAIQAPADSVHQRRLLILAFSVNGRKEFHLLGNVPWCGVRGRDTTGRGRNCFEHTGILPRHYYPNRWVGSETSWSEAPKKAIGMYKWSYQWIYHFIPGLVPPVLGSSHCSSKGKTSCISNIPILEELMTFHFISATWLRIGKLSVRGQFTS